MNEENDELWHIAQYDNTKNKSQTSCSVRDLGLENYAPAQNHASRTKEVNGNSMHVIQSHLEPSKATSCVDSSGSRRSAHGNAKKEKRARISKGIQDLRNLLPPPLPARNQQVVMEKTIEYINQLKLQLKFLNQKVQEQSSAIVRKFYFIH